MTHQFYVSAQHVYQPAQQVYPSGQLSGQQVLPGLPVPSGHETILPNAFNAMTIPDSVPVIMEYLVNISKRRAFWSLNEDILKITILTTNTLYPSRKIRHIRACTHQRPQRKLDQYAVSSEDQYAVLEIMDDPNSTMEEYKRLKEEKAQKHEKVLNWETAKYGRIWYDEDVHDLRSVENEFPAIAFNDSLKSGETLSCEPTVSSLNDEIDFKISFDDSDDEDYTVIFNKNSFSYKIISVNNLKTDSENDNEKVNVPSFPPPEPTVSCFDDLDFFKDFENEFPAIVYNDAPTSKSNLLTEPILSPQHIDKFDLNDETSLSEYDEEEQNVLYFNDLFPFNIIHTNDLKSEKDNDDNKIDIKQSLGDNVINTDVGVYAHESNKLLETRPRERISTNIGEEFINLEILKCWSLETSRRLFNTNSCSINQHGESTEQISGEFLILILFNSRI
ncbi:hypothetical protein Tco_1167073 [Tanacetum coccineum]